MAVSVYKNHRSSEERTRRKAENDDGPHDVRENEQLLAVVAVGRNAGERAYEKRRQHTHDEETADGQARAGERSDECSGGDQVEPVAKEADDLAIPEVLEIAVFADEREIAAAILTSRVQARDLSSYWRLDREAGSLH